MKTNGVKIIVEGTGSTFHSWNDWGLYITNTNYIGEPKQNTSYVTVPGSNKQIDLSEAITKHITYSSRQIKIELAGIREKENWDAVISGIRNKINGRICRFIFDNDKAYFWRGRVNIPDFSAVVRLGKLIISIPNAEPYKYELQASNEPWVWDPFNFETGVITTIGSITVDGTLSKTIPKGSMYTVPTFVCSNVAGLSVTDGHTTKTLINGSNRDARIQVSGDENVTLTFTGHGVVEIVYRGGSL